MKKRTKLSQTNSKKVLISKKMMEKRYMFGAVDPEIFSEKVTITVSEDSNKDVSVDVKDGKIVDR